MTRTRTERQLMLASFTLLLVAGHTQDTASQTRSIYQRDTSVVATITGSPRDRDGHYELKATSSICGEIPKEASLTGEGVFVVEFPADLPPGGKITNVTFGSNQLVAGVTKATRFRLSVGVVNALGGRPALYVLNTDAGQPTNSGVATLKGTRAAATLTVTGQNDAGEAIELTVTCN